MASFILKVPNNDEGEELGVYESDYLPRIGDPFTLWHRRLAADKDHPFCGIVHLVTHEATHVDHPYSPTAGNPGVSTMVTTVWIVEEMGAPTLHCDCSDEERAKHVVVAGHCDNCGGARES